jgi:hypothetical protein
MCTIGDDAFEYQAHNIISPSTFVKDAAEYVEAGCA